MTRFGHLTQVPAGRFRFVAIDVETASRHIESICQIGLCCVEDSGALHTYSCYVDPECAFAPFNSQLHGIDAAVVRDAPTFPRLFAQLLPLLEAHPLVQHSRYDQKAMAAACKRYKLPALRSTWTDSVGVARRAWPELRSAGGHGLGNLKTVLGLSFQHHDAGEDARAAAEVVLAAEGVLKRPMVARRAPEQLAFDFSKPAEDTA